MEKVNTHFDIFLNMNVWETCKQCKHIHVLRFWLDCSGQNACWGITPKPPRSPPSVTATRPADAKIIFKRKAAELVIALQLPFSYIEFISYTVHAFYIVWQIRGNLNLLSQIAYMVVDCLSGIVGVVLMPYQIQQHFIGEHSLWIQYKQSNAKHFRNSILSRRKIWMWV